MASTTPTGAAIESREEFKDTPRGQYNYWSEELNASLKMLEKWHKMGDRVVQRYLGSYQSRLESDRDAMLGQNLNRLNLFHSNVSTLESMMYGNTPKIDVSRRYADPNDDVARVAAETMERLLNLDIQDNGSEIDCIFRSVLQDRLLPGLGCARISYEFETEEKQVSAEIINLGEVMQEAVYEERVVNEAAPVTYWFWGDVIWSWARNWSEVRWVAFKNYLTKDEVKEKFGEKAAGSLTYKKQKAAADKDDTTDPIMDDNAWMKAEVWEIWDKDKREVVFVSLGYDQVLATNPDPLGLSGFFPCPPFFLANPTTDLFLPTPDYKLAEDLYNEIDILQTRISILTRAVKAVGVYNQGAKDIQRVFDEGTDNTLIPVDNWALFGEKGGLAGQIDWVPISDITNALDRLRDIRSETIGLLQQVTGMADVMRGELNNQYEGVGQTQIKAKYGSTRIQSLQDAFAQFATDLMQLKAEVISKHFDAETIITKSNMQYSMDASDPDGARLIEEAVALIKDEKSAQLRVAIRPESVAMVDHAAQQAERTSYINALATFMQSASPMMEADPNSTPLLLQLLQWGLAGFKGSSEIEGVIDRAIQQANEQLQQQQGQPDQGQAEMAAKMQELEVKGQQEMAKIQAKVEGDMQIRQQDLEADMRMERMRHMQKMAETTATMQSKISEIEAKLRADLLVEQVQMEANIAQTNATAEAEIEKDVVNTELELAKEAEKTTNEIQKIQAQGIQNIREMTVDNAQKEQTSEENDDGGET